MKLLCKVQITTFFIYPINERIYSDYMKGITPVIAIILLLLITISMAGFAFVFLQRSLEETTSGVESDLETQMNRQRQKFSIDNIDPISGGQGEAVIYIRHIGSVVADTSVLTVYVNNTPVTCEWGAGGAQAGSWAPGVVKSCNTTTIGCSGDSEIQISGPGNKDSRDC